MFPAAQMTPGVIRDQGPRTRNGNTLAGTVKTLPRHPFLAHFKEGVPSNAPWPTWFPLSMGGTCHFPRLTPSWQEKGPPKSQHPWATSPGSIHLLCGPRQGTFPYYRPQCVDLQSGRAYHSRLIQKHSARSWGHRAGSTVSATSLNTE